MAEAATALWSRASDLAAQFMTHFMKVLDYPFDPEQRVFVLYLLSSVAFAAAVYLMQSRHATAGLRPSLRGLVAFLFPREVWRTASAWLDVRYFFIHQMVRLAIYGGFLTTVTGLFYYLASVAFFDGPQIGERALVARNPVADALYLALVVLAIDLVSYAIHYAQHKVPFLWEFHKVHHSATVMHPLTNYREHPVDNLAYAIGTGMVAGLGASMVLPLLGYLPKGPTVLGVGAATFAFNLLAYNLRHSHIWLRWRPEFMNVVIGCPAHHQVHHSSHPDHIDKNFAFMFPVWDKLFGTYILPKTNVDIRFGIDDGDQADYRSFLTLYLLPFKKNIDRWAGRIPNVQRR